MRIFSSKNQGDAEPAKGPTKQPARKQPPVAAWFGDDDDDAEVVADEPRKIVVIDDGLEDDGPASDWDEDGQLEYSRRATGYRDPDDVERELFYFERLVRQRGLDMEDAEKIEDLMEEVMVAGKPMAWFLKPGTVYSPWEQAQAIMYEAFEANGRKRAKLARRALAICPDCADAYVLLGNEADDQEEAIQFYSSGVKVGAHVVREKLNGPDTDPDVVEVFEENWFVPEVRPYLRALHGLAEAQWAAADREAAIATQDLIIHLNPSDQLGVRYSMMGRLMLLGYDERAAELLDTMDDPDDTVWAWSQTLWDFRNNEREAARHSLENAFETNRHIPVIIMTAPELDLNLPRQIDFGSRDEAIDYLLYNLEAWAETPGAVDWMMGEFAAAMRKLAIKQGELMEEREDGTA